METKQLKGRLIIEKELTGGRILTEGPQGKDGLSAYEIATKNGYIGTEAEWLKTLKGDKGDKGEQGIQGPKGDQGTKGEKGDSYDDTQIKQKNTELEKELKEAQEDFYQNSIRGQASGEYIHVEDSSNCRAKIGISGNSEQETRSGKNKIEITKTTTTVNGCTHTIKDGTDTLSGTSTGWANLIIYSFTGDGETYTLSGSPTSSKNIFISARDNTQNKDLATSKNGSTGTFVATSGNPIDIIICVASNITLTNELFKPQLELGSNATEWEQGGAMPSPNHQSEIKTVGSNVNIFDKDTHILVNSSEIRVRTDYILLKKGTYTLNFIGADSFYLIIFNENKVKVEETDWTEKNSSFELDNKYYVVIIFRKNNNIALNKDEVVNIKLVEGTEVGEYSSYGQGCVKVTKCNKNLVNVGENSYSTMGLNITLDKSRIKINGTPTSNNFIFKKDDINAIYLGKFKKGTYYMTRQQFSGFTKKGNGFSVQIRKDVWNGTAVANYGMETTLQQKKVILDEDVDLYLTMWANKDDIYNNVEFLFSIYSDTDVNHVQHQEQSYIMPVQQEMLEGDYFDFDNEEEVHIFGKKVLTGNENWEAIGTNTSGKYRFQTKVDDIAFNADGDTYLEGICDSYKVGTPNTTYLCQESIATVQNYLIIYNEKVNDTVENFEKGLSNKNVTIYYKLATPARLPFTDEQKAVAKELNNARTYKNVTNITTDSIAILDLDYAKDLETLLNNTQALAVNNASEGV